MGLGDELMAAGEARRIRRMGDPPVVVVGRDGELRSHRVWAHCPDVSNGQRLEGAPVMVNGPGARPYVDYERSTGGAWAWKPYQPTPARVVIDPALIDWARNWQGHVVIEPTLKPRANVNKDWGWHRWQHLCRLRRDVPFVQIGPPGTRWLDRANFVPTPTVGHMLAMLSVAAAAVLPEGGMHHAAAAVDLPVVVIFGGYISPEITGYAGHVNIYDGGEPCGSRQACPHCAARMEQASPRRIAGELDNLLNRGHSMSSLIEHGGLWLPAGEKHLLEWMDHYNVRVDGRLTYQWNKIEAALALVRGFRTAIDVGGHCGLWSMHLAKRFRRIEAFEPVPLYREAFAKNVPQGPAEVRLWDCALGNSSGFVSMRCNPVSSGDSWVVPGSYSAEEGETAVKRLDDLEIDGPVDFIKLDCEGFELFALQGGEQLLRRWHPTVCVEQKPNRAEKYGLPRTEAVAWLKTLGAKQRREIGGDYLMTWDA